MSRKNVSLVVPAHMIEWATTMPEWHSELRASTDLGGEIDDHQDVRGCEKAGDLGDASVDGLLHCGEDGEVGAVCAEEELESEADGHLGVSREVG